MTKRAIRIYWDDVTMPACPTYAVRWLTLGCEVQTLALVAETIEEAVVEAARKLGVDVEDVGWE